MTKPLSRAQCWLLVSVARYGKPSVAARWETVNLVVEAGLIVHDEAAGWRLTAAGEEELERAQQRLRTRES